MRRIVPGLATLTLGIALTRGADAGAATRVETAVVNPASGVALYVASYRPPSDGPLPALVLVPGGVQAGSDAFERRGTAARLAERGFVVVVFDPDGRGRSGGREDAGGSVHQDGLAAVIEATATFPGVDAGRIGVVSYSYGVTMASGALARYPALPVRFLIDWEGPADRTSTGCRAPRSVLGRPCVDDAYWAEREAATFLMRLAAPYQRIQTARDHVHGGDASHAVRLVNAATDAHFGGAGRSPFTRLNDEPPNRVYASGSLPPLPEEAGRSWLEERIAGYAWDLLALP